MFRREAVDLRWDHDGQLGLGAEAFAGGDDGEIDGPVRGGVGDGVDLRGSVVGVGFRGRGGAVDVVVQDGCPAGVDEDRRFTLFGALGQAVEDGGDGGEMVGGCGVDDDGAGEHVVGDQGCVVEGADDGEGAGGAELVGGSFAPDEGGDTVAGGEEEVEDVQADEAGADEEDGLGRRHCAFEA